MTPVYFAILPEVVLLDVAGAAEAFRMANHVAANSYELHFVGTQRRTRSAIGLHLSALERLPTRLPDGAIVVVAGVTSSYFSLSSPAVRSLAAWLQRMKANETVTVMCVCAGSLIAAAAGLLKHRQCTTHHDFIDELARIEPTATVHDNRIFVEDGPVFTSAGVTAGIDLALHVIGRQLGHRVAVAVARDLVVYMRRSGTDPQLSPWVMHRNHVHPAVHKVQDAITRDPARAWSARRLAAVACTSPRHLARLFAEHAGCSPLDYVQRLRVALARELLSHGELALDRVAEKAGFSSAHQLRRVWRRWETQSPTEHRAQSREFEAASR